MKELETEVRPDGAADDAGLLASLRHPLRREILVLAASLPVVTPRALADELHEPLSNVSYHVRELAGFGALILVRTDPVRGSVSHSYRFGVTAPWALAVLGLEPAAFVADRVSPDGGEES